MPSADSCTAIKHDYSCLSLFLWLQTELCLLCLPPGFPVVPQYLSHTSRINTVQASRGKTQSFPCVNAGFIKHTQITDGGLRGHVPTRPGCTTPHIQFLFPGSSPGQALPRTFGLGFLQTPPHDDALALLLTFGSDNTWYEDFLLASSVPCPAHTTELSGGV